MAWLQVPPHWGIWTEKWLAEELWKIKIQTSKYKIQNYQSTGSCCALRHDARWACWLDFFSWNRVHALDKLWTLFMICPVSLNASEKHCGLKKSQSSWKIHFKNILEYFYCSLIYTVRMGSNTWKVPEGISEKKIMRSRHLACWLRCLWRRLSHIEALDLDF